MEYHKETRGQEFHLFLCIACVSLILGEARTKAHFSDSSHEHTCLVIPGSHSENKKSERSTFVKRGNKGREDKLSILFSS